VVKEVDLGTFVGGNPGKFKISENLPHISPSGSCGEEARWEAEYEVTSPKPLYAEPAAEHGVLCTETATPCPAGKDEPGSDDFSAALASGTTSKLELPYGTIECEESSMTAGVSNPGGSTENVEVVGSGSFGGCTNCFSEICKSCTVAVSSMGAVSFQHISSSDNATLTSNGTSVTTKCGSVFGLANCIYTTANTHIGTFVGGSPAKLLVSAELIPLNTGGICEAGPTAHWEAEYEITSPAALYSEPVGSFGVLCEETATPCPEGKELATGPELVSSLGSGVKSKLKTSFKTIECGKSTLNAQITNTGGESFIEGRLSSLSFEECNCTVTVLKSGTIKMQHIASTENATLTSTGTEVTTPCNTEAGEVHCIYTTSDTDLGTFAGGNPPVVKVNAELTRLATNAACASEAHWEAEYEVTSPKPLYAEPIVVAETVFCTEKGMPCPTGKADGIGAEITASLVAGTKSKLTTPYNNIECGKSSISGKVTSTSEKISAGVEGLSFEECNCEVKVLGKGTLEMPRITGTENATVTSTGTEITTLCSTITGNVHCIYKTTATDIGTLEGGNPAKVSISGAGIPRLATDSRCNEGEGAKWDAEYEVTSPKPLYVEPK